MSFSSASLTVGKDGAIVALEDVLDDVCRTPVVNISLGYIPIEHLVESELLGSFITHRLINEDFTSLGLHIDDHFVVRLHFFLTQGSASDDDFNCLGVGGGLLLEQILNFGVL